MVKFTRLVLLLLPLWFAFTATLNYQPGGEIGNRDSRPGSPQFALKLGDPRLDSKAIGLGKESSQNDDGGIGFGNSDDAHNSVNGEVDHQKGDKVKDAPDGISIEIKLQLGIVWTEALGMKSSNEFKAVENGITENIHNLYENVPGYQKSELRELRPSSNGSTTATLMLISFKNDNETQLKSVFENYLKQDGIDTYSSDVARSNWWTVQTQIPQAPETPTSPLTRRKRSAHVPLHCNYDEFKCSTIFQCISKSAICDGSYDCLDRSDESSCPRNWLNIKIYPYDQIVKENQDVVIQCRDEGPMRARVQWFKNDQDLPFPPDTCDHLGRLEMMSVKMRDAGVYLCKAIDYLYLPGSSDGAYLRVEENLRPTYPPHNTCGPSEEMCSNKQCIPRTKICDGRKDCPDGSDEDRCPIDQEDCEANMFKCDNNKCILKTMKCDQNNDCGDGSDEHFCDELIHGSTRDAMNEVETNTKAICSCHPCGSLSNSCDEQGMCPCKKNVVGESCDVCKPGFYGLGSSFENGCSPCWCSGVTNVCTDSPMTWSTIRLAVNENPDQRPKVVTNKMAEVSFKSELRFVDKSNELLLNHISNGLNTTINYWRLPPMFVGNKLMAFEGNLTVTQRFFGNGASTSDSPDLIMVGNQVTLQWYSTIAVYSGVVNVLTVPLQSAPEWKMVYGGTVNNPTRDDFLHVLSQIESIYVKASPFSSMIKTFLSKVMMDVAVPFNTPSPKKFSEMCQCPQGYVGTSCESCDTGYYRDLTKKEPGFCTKCDCHDREVSCQMNNPQGTLDCLCKEGYDGNRCEIAVTTTPHPESPIVVAVKEPKLKILQVGESVTLICKGHIEHTGKPLNVTWAKENGHLPKMSTNVNGKLFLPSVTMDDAGTYVCSGANGIYTMMDSADLYVRMPGDVDILIEPSYPHATEGEQLQLNCIVRLPGYVTEWTKEGGSMPHNAYEQSGRLVIPEAHVEDAGVYVCVGTSYDHKTITAETVVDIRKRPSLPIVRMNIKSVTIPQGSSYELNCTVEGDEPISIVWSKAQENLAHQRNVYAQGPTLYLRNVDVSDRGMYVCTAENAAGVSFNGTYVDVAPQEHPQLKLYPADFYKATEGRDAHVQCMVTAGIPTPTVVWQRKDGKQLEKNVQLRDDWAIYIPNVTLSNRGLYECVVENEVGVARGIYNLIVQIEPTVQLQPDGIVHIQKGDNLYLRCVAQGDPSPVVSWEKLHAPPHLPPLATDQHGCVDHVIRDIAMEDGGYYLCKASNEAGYADDAVMVVVYDHLEHYPTPPPRREDPTTPHVVTDRNQPRHEDSTTSYTGQETTSIFDVPVGSKIEMRCLVALQIHEQLFVKWKRMDGRPLPIHSIEENGVLKISSVTASDNGIYICECYTSSERYIVAQGKSEIRTYQVPSVDVSPKSQEVRPGELVTITCSVTGDDPIDITWTKKGSSELPNSALVSGIKELHFKDISKSDGGQYVCKASNLRGSSEATAEIIVTDDFIVSPTVDKVTTIIGLTVDLVCDLEEKGSGSGSPQSIKWKRENGTIAAKAIRVGKYLTIPDASFGDAGLYQCILGKRIQKVALVVQRQEDLDLFLTGWNVFIRPSIAGNVLHSGDNLILDCGMMNGEKSINVNWQKVPDVLPSNVEIAGSSLIFTNLQKHNEGTYRCSINTKLGIVTKDYDVVVKDSVVSRTDDKVEEVTVDVGSRVVINCRIPVGVHKFSWEKEKGQISADVNTKNTNFIVIENSEPRHAGTYICKGINPSTSSLEKRKIVVKVKGVVPRFSRASYSYMKISGIPDLNNTFEFSVSFKTESPNGMIFFSGDTTHYFLSLTISNGVPNFKIGFRGQLASVKSQQPLTLNEWHRINVKKQAKGVLTMSINGGMAVLDTLTKDQRVNEVPSKLFLGGLSEENPGDPEGFVGCMTDLVINGKRFEISPYHTAKTSYGISSCDTCEGADCKNGGICQETNSMNGFTCLCKPGFSGDVCEKVGESCFPGACGQRGQCSEKSDGGYECSCPYKKSGPNCERDIQIKIPYFSRDSYLAFSDIKNTFRALNMVFKFKSEDANDGLMMYGAKGREDVLDYIALVIVDGYLQLRIDTGSGVSTLQSTQQIVPNRWYSVEISRSLKKMKMKLTGEPELHGTSAGKTRGLTITNPFYFGGVNHHEQILPPGMEEIEGFSGCIHSIVIQGIPYNPDDTIDSSNVQECNSHMNKSSCDDQPCRNGGTCQWAKFGAFQCLCVDGFGGVTCSERINLCKERKPCKGGSTCVSTDKAPFYRCNCPLGLSGDRCETKVAIGRKLKFKGNGFIEYPATHRTSFSIKIVLNTEKSEGLILWTGRNGKKKQEFFTVALNDGFPCITFAKGPAPHVVAGNKRINDGAQHFIEISLVSGKASISIDHDFPVYKLGVGKFIQSSSWFLGGLEDFENTTSSWFASGFDGCIYSLVIEGKLYHGAKDSIRAANVLPCGYESDYFDDNLEDEDKEYDDDKFLERGNRKG